MRKTVMRYLDDQKLEWLLSDNGLYLSAASDQSDKDEGVYYHTFLSAYIAKTGSDVDSALLANLDQSQLNLQKINRETSFLSCWYLGSEESMDMWEEFGRNGVVIFSDDWALSDALPEPLEQATAYYDVIYSDVLKPHASHEPLRVKHSKFHKEREFRIVFELVKYSMLTGFEARNVRVGGVLTHLDDNYTSCMSKKGKEQSHKVIRKKGRGYIFDYILNSIIREIRVHPDATDAELLKVMKRLREAGLNCPINHSVLRVAH
ncbi:hypothetical protein [Pseudomonas sp. C32]|uniref:hypothetical protein n=1 Tax=Pseudomonas sp. C32 TaxID=1529208 RepID=UPI00262B937A|nr:hypothetical protein [Pseudomonas sp. C32]MDN4547175.1 hypothetical protein [Pseudomonas sp. C32]